MKKIVALLLLLGIFATKSFAQILEDTKVMSEGANNCLTMTFLNVDDKDVLDLWKDVMKDYGGKLKKVKKSSDYKVDDILIAGITNENTMDVFVQIEEKKGDVTFMVWFDLGGAFLSKSAHPTSYDEALNFLEKFALDVERMTVQNELDNEMKEFDKMKKDLKRLDSKKENLEKAIVRYKEKIKDAETDLIKNEAEQESMKSKIDEQKSKIENVNKKLKEVGK